MVEVLLVAGLIVAGFVGFNIGGSSTGVAFGPAVGAGLLRKVTAGALMSVFVLLGGWTVGRNVVETMGGKIVPADYFTLSASVAILLFIGLGMLVANVYGVPVSTSMTAVGAIAGLGLAVGDLNFEEMGRIVLWWIVAPVLAFWIGGVIGRYLYPHLEARFAVETTPGSLFALDRSGTVPRPTLGPNTTPREVVGSALVVAIACYMAFSAGASNVANAVAPLVGSEAIEMNAGILLGGVAIGLGGFTIARRTMDTVGTDLTDLPILAALIVAVVSSTITTFLSYLGIPVSLALSSIMCIVGLGWGRATRVATISDTITRKKEVDVSVHALTADEGRAPEDVERIGEEEPDDLRVGDLYDAAATARVISLWIFSPSAAATISYLFFRVVGV
ncbi:inorganic phosphate transporter [Natronoarchaeum rubrum]|uniref:inorganic phosphate transporter n=1 Tax=Natronoarchaeum rubrum TaxID=755311 RepID=UPI0021117793|nr:inorganic phosphate transporter [Natronoarchaeum rubrum]